MARPTPRHRSRSRSLALVAISATVLLAACQFTVPPGGMTFAPAHGRIRVVFPPGAVPTATATEVLEAVGTPEANAVDGTAWVLQPAVAWQVPVEVTLAYDPADLPPGVEEADLVLVRLDGPAWTPVAPSAVDVARDRVTASLETGGTVAVGWVGCDVRHPATCTLAAAAAPAGIRMGATLEPGEIDDAAYAGTLAREFGSMTPENAMKMYSIQDQRGTWTFAGADAVLAFAEANDLEVRGHTLVWGQDQYTPAWVRAITDPAELQAVTDEHIETVVGRYAGRIERWDVVNEPLATLGTGRAGSVWDDLLGPGWIAHAFRVAHAADPTAELWLNEYGTDWVPGKHAALLALVSELVGEGVPIHGVGLQTHRLSPTGPTPATFEQQLRDLADLGLEVAITELDIPTNPNDANGPTNQAAAYARIASACLAVPACVEITTWGITDAKTWLDALGTFPTPTRPLLFDGSYAPKPAYHSMRAALAAGRPTTG
jgi:endo-1,4-beta-xylanase